MLLADLEDCLRRVNLGGLNILDGTHGLNPDPARSTEAARVYPAMETLTAGSLIRAPANAGFIGRMAGGHACRGDLEAHIYLTSHDPMPTYGRVAVGAVVDSLSQPLPGDDPRWSDLPVVLAVGINPGWQGQPPAPRRDFLARPPSLYEDTGLRPRLEGTVGELRKIVDYRMNDLPTEGRYHLVAASFFPWVTTAAWPAGATPALAEELLLGYFGWNNPLDFIVYLIQALWRDTAPPKASGRHRGLTHVVFHGADNAAARCGRALVGQMNENKEPIFKCSHPLRNLKEDKQDKLGSPEVIFCDDPAASEPGTLIENAVWLGREYYGTDEIGPVLNGDE